MDQKIEPLTGDEAAHVQKQRIWVREHYEPHAEHKYDTIEGKLNLLKAILDAGWIEPEETWKLQSLGITFGDALSQKMNLIWVTVEDEYGRDPALMVPKTTILVFPLTAISKRIERGESVDVFSLFDEFCQFVIDQKSIEAPPH